MAQEKLPVVSVVMPVYNTERFIRKSIESILNQTFDDFEFIIVDDSSTDGTEKILNEYIKRDKRIKVITLRKKGLVASLNEGIKHAKGEYIARMDSDDIALPERFEKQISYLQQNHEIVALGSRVLLIDEAGRPLMLWNYFKSNNEIVPKLLTGHGGALIHPAIMVRRTAIEKIGGYDERYVVMEDLDLYLKLSEIGKLENLSDVLLYYRQHPESAAATGSHLWMDTVRLIITDAINRRGVDKYVYALFNKRLHSINYQTPDYWARSALRSGYYKTAFYYSWRIIKFGPSRMKGIRIIYEIGKTIVKKSIHKTLVYVLSIIRSGKLII